MAKYATLNALFTAIANSLRSKTNSSGNIVADDFPSVIDSLSTGGITPTGTKNITTNGEHDVTSFAKANVNVPIGVTPSGTKNITTNGTHDVTNYANAEVNVPIPSGYIKPSGTKQITENGTHDVTNYASAAVNVPTPEQISVVRTVTISADVVGANATTNLLTNDEFIKKHYADTGFSATMLMTNPIASETGAVHFIYHGNKNIASTNVTRTGIVLKSTSASAIGTLNCTANINGKGYGVHFRAASDGSLKMYLANGNTLKAGTYQVVLTCTT